MRGRGISIKMAASINSISCRHLLKKIRFRTVSYSLPSHPRFLQPVCAELFTTRTAFWNVWKKSNPEDKVFEHEEAEEKKSIYSVPPPSVKSYTPQPDVQSVILPIIQDVIPDADIQTIITDLNHKFQILLSLEKQLKLPIDSPDLSDITSVKDIVAHYSQVVDSTPTEEVLCSSELPPNLCMVMDPPRWKPGQPTAFPGRKTHIYSLRRREQRETMKGEQEYKKKWYFEYEEDGGIPYRE